MVEMIKEREENRRHYMLLFALGGVSLISFLTLLFVACLPTGAVSLTLRLVILLIAFVIFAVGLLAVIEGQRKIGYYRCAGCSETFVPTFWAHAFGLNIVSKRLLKCPYCGAALGTDYFDWILTGINTYRASKNEKKIWKR